MVHASLTSNRRQRWVAVWLILRFALHSSANFQAAMSQNTNFTFDRFDNPNQLLFLGDAAFYVDSLYLNSIGVAAPAVTCAKALFQTPVRLLHTDSSNATTVASFSTAFTFSMTTVSPLRPYDVVCTAGGDGLAFVFSADNFTEGDPGGNLCTIRNVNDGMFSNHMFMVEFDTYYNDYPPYFDVSNNHVGVNVNSMHSEQSYNLCKNNSTNCTYLVTGKDFSAWIDFHGENHTIEVRLANGSITKDRVTRPAKPLMPALQLPEISTVLLEYMYIGFAGSVYGCSQVTAIKSWRFSSTGMPELVPAPALAPDPGKTSTSSKNQVVILISVIYAASAVFLLVVILLLYCLLRDRSRRRRGGYSEPFEQTLFLPREFTYKELATATNGFSEARILGRGGFGKVYKGTLPGSQEVAVKRMKHESARGASEFAAEISVISQIRHRNLVVILGWCREDDQLLIVYEYMPNGDLHKWLFSEKATKLTWDMRYNILRGLAAALAYLHEEWAQCIVHRDIKASNVLLDGVFNARLADFGLARLMDHGAMPKSTALAGTLGYLAPELPRTMKATKKSDVYSFGVLALEVACGRPVYSARSGEEESFLQDFVWDAQERGDLVSAADERLLKEFNASEMKLALSLGLLCCHPEPDGRPSMRFAHQCIVGEAVPPPVPPSRPPELVGGDVVRYSSTLCR